MTSRVDELLTELAVTLPHVTTPFTGTDRADRIYEAYGFAQVIAAAAESGAEVTFENTFRQDVRDLVFRGAPGVLHSGRPFTHAVLHFGQARPLEVHLRVTVKGRTFESESDVLIIDAQMAQDSRDKRKLPTANGCVLTIECKYYVRPLPKDEAVNYLGVRSGFPPSMASLFVTNSFSSKANHCLSDRSYPYEFRVMPGTRFQNHVRSHIRQALRRHVVQFDHNHQM